MGTSLLDVLKNLGSGALEGTLKGLDIMPDDDARKLLGQTLTKIFDGSKLQKPRQQRLIGLLRDAAAEAYIKGSQ